MSLLLDFIKWIGTFFDSQQSTSSRRLCAFVILVVSSIGSVHFFFWCTFPWLHIYLIIILLVFILMMYGLVTFGDLVKLKTGVKFTESNSETENGSTKTREKIVTEPVPAPIEPII